MTLSIRGALSAIAFSAVAFSSQGTALAASEAKDCPAEPTQNVILVSGDVFGGAGCAITPAADLDSFRFGAQMGETYRLAVAMNGSGYPNNICLDLYDPAQAKIFTACSNTGNGSRSVVTDQTIVTTGAYTGVVYEQGSDAVISYGISLERLNPASADAVQIGLGQAVVDEINPLADSDAYVFSARTTGTYRLTASVATGGYPANVCMDVIAPDGTRASSQCTRTGNPNGNSFLIDFTPTQNGPHVVLLYEQSYDATIGYNLNVACLVGTCASGYPPCTLRDGLSYDPISQTLTMNFLVGHQYQEHVTWNAWLSHGITTESLFSVSQPFTDPPVPVVQTRSNLAPSGKVGVLSTLTTPKRGITCSSWVQISTGTP